MRRREVISTHSGWPAGEIFELNFPNNADDRDPTRIFVHVQKVSRIHRPVHPFPDGIDARPESRGETLVHDHGQPAGLVVVFVKVPAAHERSLHCFEITRRDGDLHRGNQGLAGFHLVSLCDDDTVAVIAAERNVRGSSCVRHTRDAPDGLQRAIRERAHIAVVGVADSRHAYTAGDDTFSFESGIDGKQVSETGEQQSGADQQHKSEGDLSDDENASKSACFPPAGAGPAFLVQNSAEVHIE